MRPKPFTEEWNPRLLQDRKSISGSSVVGYAFAGKHSWPPSWVGALRQLEVISGSITPTAASRQSLYLRTGAIWLSHFAPVPATKMPSQFTQTAKAFFCPGRRVLLAGQWFSGRRLAHSHVATALPRQRYLNAAAVFTVLLVT